MKAKFLKIAGVKSEKEFYKKYPTEAAFFKAHPEAKKQIKKAQVGAYIGGEKDASPETLSYYDYENLVPLRTQGKTLERMRQEEMERAQGSAGGSGEKKGSGFDINNLISSIGKFSKYKGSKFGDIAGGGGGMITPGIGDSPGGGVNVGNMAREGAEIEKAQDGGIFGSGEEKRGNQFLQGIASGLPIVGGLFRAGAAIKDLKERRKKTEASAKLSDLALQASQTQPERKARRYVRPEDAIVSPNERFIPGGTGTEILAQYGASIGGNPTEIQNMYNPGDMYSNLGYEPLSESDIVKQYQRGGTIPKAQSGFGDFMTGGGGQAIGGFIGSAFQDDGGGEVGSEIGGSIGQGVGMLLGPVGSAIAGPVGQLLGGAIGAAVDGGKARKEKRQKQQIKRNTETMAMQDSVRGALGNYSAHVRNGGDIPYGENGWVSHDWQPQKIAKWGDINVEDVDDIFRPADMKTLEYGGPIMAQKGVKEEKKETPLPKDYRSRWNSLSKFIRDQVGYDVKNPKASAEKLRGMPETQAFLKQYNESHPDAPFDPSWVPHVQKEFAEVILPRDKAFAERRGIKLPEKDLSAYEGIIGYRTAGYNYPDLVEVQSSGQENPMGIIGGGFSQDYGSSYTNEGGGGQGTSSMSGLIPGRITIGGKSVNVKIIDGKGYFTSPTTGDTIPYNPKRYQESTGRYFRTGGNLRQNDLSDLDQFNFGGNLKTHWGGKAEVDSYNPYLPGTGETVMFKGNYHSQGDGKGNTGIGVSYGPKEHDSYTDYAEYGSEQAADVEVENGEPAAELPDSNGDLSMTVFGALPINKHAADEIGDPKAKGLTYKKYVDRLNNEENKSNKKIAKANEELERLRVLTPFDKLKLNSLNSIIQGEDQKLKDYAVKKVTAAEVQNAYNETAEEYGLDANDLAKGKLKPSKDMDKAKYGKEIEKAQGGYTSGASGVGRPTGSAYSSASKPSPASSKNKSNSKKKKASGKKKDDILSAIIKPPKITDADWKEPELIGVDYKPKEKSQLELLEEQGLGPTVTASQRRERDLDKAYDRLSESEKIKYNADVEAARKKAGEKKDTTDWKEFAKIAATQLANALRKPLQEDLDPSQLIPEMLAKAQNQLEPVQAQKYQPLLDTPFDVSFQDQLNENQASFNAIQRQLGANPAALSALAATKYAADSKVLADQFRTNQAMRSGVFSKNRDTLNDAALKNLAILDQQYTRQAEAISKTKATDLEIAKSIADKIAKNRLENRTFAAMSNMFPQYGFDKNMRAFSQLPTWFQKGIVGSTQDAEEKETKKEGTGKYGKNLKKYFKNGSIVKSLKNI